MNKILSVLLAGILILGSASFGRAEQKRGQGTMAEAKAMIEKAGQWFKKYGKEKILAEISRAGTEKRGQFIDRDLYVFAYDFRGVNVAHGANPKLVGRDLIDMQDADGRYLIRGLIDTARKGSGWYYYKWSNPITKKIEDKMAYVLKLDDNLWIGCGVYGKEVHRVVQKRIGVRIFFEQARYSESLRGIMDQLKKEGFKEPAVKFTVGNAKGSYVQAEELVKRFAASKLDLIVTLGTNATIAVTKKIKDIPAI